MNIIEKTPNPKHNAINLFATENEKRNDLVACAYTNPALLAAISIKDRHATNEEIDLTSLITAMNEQASLVHKGNLRRVETMLIAQAHSLDTLFLQLTSRARGNMGENLNAMEKYMRLALKAQSQCRTTLETLANIKNPQPYIQNNRAEYQQVNNGIPHDNETNTRTHAPARENFISSNELLSEDSNNETLDTGRTPAASGTNQDMEAVGKIHRG